MTCYHPRLVELVNPRSMKYDPKHKLIYHGALEHNILRVCQEQSGAVSEFKIIPCGQCLGCRIDKARDWSVRLMCECATSDSAYFLTLTYDDEHLPSDRSLHKDHVQKFIKDLRNYVYYLNPYIKLRYFLSGEYGEKFGRCHFHVILFNMPKMDLIQYKVTNDGNILYVSDKLNEIWEKGFVTIGSLTMQSANYVARYTLKKLNAPEYERLNIQPPFILMSCRPGIGFEYARIFKDKLLTDKKIYLPNGNVASIPRYFLRVLSTDPDYEEAVDLYKEELSENSFDRKFIKFIESNNTEIEDLLRHEELNLEALIKQCKGGSL